MKMKNNVKFEEELICHFDCQPILIRALENLKNCSLIVSFDQSIQCLS